MNGDGAGGVLDTTGWQNFTVNLGPPGAGGHVLTPVGYNNEKSQSTEYTEKFSANGSMTVNCASCPTHLEQHYDPDSEGDLYSDDAYFAATAPAYAAGSWEADGLINYSEVLWPAL